MQTPAASPDPQPVLVPEPADVRTLLDLSTHGMDAYMAFREKYPQHYDRLKTRHDFDVLNPSGRNFRPNPR